MVDPDAAFRVLNATRRQPVDERRYLAHGGFIPEKEEHSVSKALEQAKADSCVGRVARDLGHVREAEFFESQARSVYRHWDPKHSLFVPLGGTSAQPRLLRDTARQNQQTRAYTEGSALQYSWE